MSRLLALFLLLLAHPLAAQTFPPLSGRVVDAANILSPEVRQRMEAKSAEIEKQTSTQLVVATIPDLEGYPIEDYGYRLGRHWGIGQKDKDNGAILIVAPNDRQVRIEVGYGLEPVLTDALSSVIIQRTMLPKAREGDLAGGTADAFDALAQQLALPPEKAAANVKAAEVQARENDGSGFGGLMVILFLGFWFYMAFRRSKGGRRRGGGIAPIVIWGPGSGGWGSGGGGFGGGGFGGGGFGGGGGGFGGGGASGGW